ncbi:MAG: 30S ribosome-binding factor RbfA [Clostridiales bacterium]|nr:30S ribosome-binding factor RbfA [Clostridiales bacterium]
MKTNSRMIRINDEIKKEISEILRSGLKDPRISSLISVLKVETTTDLKYCKVYVSVLGSGEQIKTTMDVLKGARGYIRSLLAERINLRLTPEINFIYDDSLVYGMHISKILNDLNLSDDEDETEGSEGADDNV